MGTLADSSVSVPRGIACPLTFPYASVYLSPIPFPDSLHCQLATVLLYQYQDDLLKSGSLMHPENRNTFQTKLAAKHTDDVRKELALIHEAQTLASIITARRNEPVLESKIRLREKEGEKEGGTKTLHVFTHTHETPAPDSTSRNRRVIHQVVSSEFQAFDTLAAKHDDPLAQTVLATPRGVRWDEHLAASCPNTSNAESQKQDPNFVAATLLRLLLRFTLLDGGKDASDDAPPSKQVAKKNETTPPINTGVLQSALADMDGLRPEQVLKSQQIRSAHNRKSALLDPATRPPSTAYTVNMNSEGMRASRPASVLPGSAAQTFSKWRGYVGLEIDPAPPHYVLGVQDLMDVNCIRQGEEGKCQ
jgi:hypothetical protein